MTNKEKTYVAFILDKSGSMMEVKSQTIKGFNEHVEQIKEDSKDTEIFTSLVTFNGEVYESFWNQPADSLVAITNKDYKPSGSTALNDAIGYTLRKLADTTDVNDENNSYLIFILSDGDENASHKISQAEVKELIDSYSKNESWTFTYLGCDASYLEKVSRNLNIPISNMAVYTANAAGTKKVFEHSKEKFGDFLRSRKAGVKSLKACYYSNDALSLADFSVDQSVDNTMKSQVVDNNSTDSKMTS